MTNSTTCIVSECIEKPSRKRVVTKGMCSKHYTASLPGCVMDGCNKPVHGATYCRTHYARFKKHGSAEDSVLLRNPNVGSCSIEGCDNPMRKRGWCVSHYSQWRQTGEVRPEIRKWGERGDCLVCGAPCTEKGRRKYCSPSCQQAAFRYNNNRPTVTTCASCEKPFSLARRDGRFQRTDTKWCRDCRRSRSEPRRYLFYGVTQAWYVDQVARGCSICGASDRKFHVDHDHKCCPGKYSCGECVRGLLCSQCNQALGLFGDDTSILHQAIEYLNN